MITIAQALEELDGKIRLVWCLMDVYSGDKDWVAKYRQMHMDRIDELLEERFFLMNQ